MKRAQTDSDFLSRPGAAERWIRSSKPAAAQDQDRFSARLTIDVTPAMRRRLKLAALTQGASVADLMRALIDQHFPDAAIDAGPDIAKEPKG
jgi:hypothetical protein